MELKAVIIEDEEQSRSSLQSLINEFCENVTVIDTADSVMTGVKSINRHQPDVIFLDIQMPGQNGFELLEYFPEPSFEVVFTTAYSEYAVKAFELSATDYILKPIGIQNLRKAVKKVFEKRDLTLTQKRLQVLKENINNLEHKIALPTKSGYSFIDLQNLIRCEAQSNYTMFFLKNNEKILVSKTLKVYEDILSEFNFIRINRSQLVNMNHICKYGRQKNPILIMSDNSELNVSEGRKEEFLNRVENLLK